MDLSKAELPEATVRTLRRFNIRDVETLLSMLATASGLVALSRILQMTTEAVRQLGDELRERFPDLQVKPAGASPPRAMGHRLPSSPGSSVVTEGDV